MMGTGQKRQISTVGILTVFCYWCIFVLTPNHRARYAFFVAGILATGIGVPNEGGHTATSLFLAVFLCPLIMDLLLLGGLCGEP